MSSSLSAPSHPFFLLLFVYLPPRPSLCSLFAADRGRCHTAPPPPPPRRPLAKLNHFHREYICHVQNLPDNRERSYVIFRAPAYNRLFIFYVNVHCPSRILVPYHAYFFPFLSTTSIPTTVLIIRPSYHPRTETAM